MLTGLVPLEIFERKFVPGLSPGFQGVAAGQPRVLWLVQASLHLCLHVHTVFLLCLSPNFPILKEGQSYWINTYLYDLTITQLITSAPQGTRVAKNLPASAGDVRDVGSIPGLGRSPGVGNGNPLRCSCLEISWRGAEGATVHGVTESQSWLSMHPSISARSLFPDRSHS